MTAQERRSARQALLALLLAGLVGSGLVLATSPLFQEEATAAFPGAVLLALVGLVWLRPRA